jgi:hypothetical protein
VQPAPPSRQLVILREKAARLLGATVRDYRQVDDRFEVPYESTHIAVHPIDWTEGRTLLRIIAPVVVDVSPAAELYQRLSELNDTTIFGKYYVRNGTVFIEHNLLGESVDAESFRAALASVAHHAGHVDEALMAEFGGHRWRESP